MRFIPAAGAPRPAGHYSQAVVHGGLVYVAGQPPIGPDDPQRPLQLVDAQAPQGIGKLIPVPQTPGTGGCPALKAARGHPRRGVPEEVPPLLGADVGGNHPHPLRRPAPGAQTGRAAGTPSRPHRFADSHQPVSYTQLTMPPRGPL